MIDSLQKAYGLPETIDPNHVYIYRSGEDGVYQYWYADVRGNFTEYTNAPEDSPDYDPFGGNAIIVRDQPFPGTAPQYFSPEGRKLSLGIPEGVETLPNESYNPQDPTQVWYGVYISQDGSNRRYVYYDSDIRENLDLWVQYQIRVVDAGIPALRSYAVKLFNSTVVKDRVLGALIMLCDQGMYNIKDLIFAAVKDLEFIDTTVKLLGRKFICDPDLLDFMTSLIVDRDMEAPLFVIETMRGQEPIGIRHITSLFYALKVSPTFLHYWNANHAFSRIVHRLSLQAVPPEEVLDLAYNELARVFATSDDVRTMIDAKIRDTLLRNYTVQAQSLADMNAATKQPQEANPAYAKQPEQDAPTGEQTDQPEEDVQEEGLNKSITRINTDDFGVAMVFSDLTKRKSDEENFSRWLHSSPLHQETPEQEAAVDNTLAVAKEKSMQEEDGKEEVPNESNNP